MIDDDRGGMESDHGGRSKRRFADAGEGLHEAHTDEAPEAGPVPGEAPETTSGPASGAASDTAAEPVSGTAADLPVGAPGEPDAADGPGKPGADDGPGAGEARAREDGAREPGTRAVASWPSGTDGHEPAPGPDENDAARDHDGDAARTPDAAHPDAAHPGAEPPDSAPPGPRADGGDGYGADGSGPGGEGGSGASGGENAPGGPGTAPVPAAAGMAGLPTPYKVVAWLVAVVFGLGALVHMGMVFLYVAPSNTLTKQNGKTIEDWIYPEFEQNWKLFAPNPLQQNVAVHVRAEIVDANGERRTTPWMSLTAEDGKAIRGNPLPSHAHQNELRRAWDFFVNTHDDKNRSTGRRGELSERYIRRIVMLRLGEHDYGGTVDRIQLRSSSRFVGAPPWSTEKIDTRPAYRELGWWTVSTDDLPEGSPAAAAASGEEADQ